MKSLASFLCALCVCTLLGDARAQSILISSNSGSGLLDLGTNAPKTYNWGITTLGGSQSLIFTNIGIYMNRGPQTATNFQVTIYRGLGGPTNGNTILTNYSISETNINQGNTTLFNLLLNNPILLSNGNYSLQLSSTADTGNTGFGVRQGTLNLFDSNGTTPLPTALWVADTNTTGSAGTNIEATFVLADYMVSKTNINFGNYRVGSTVNTNLSLTNTAPPSAGGVTEQLSTVATTSNAATVANLSTNLVARAGVTNFTVGLSTVNAGTNSGKVALSYSSLTNGTASPRTGGATNVGSQVVDITGVGYRLATDAVSTTNVNLGNFRIVDGVGTTNVAITNTATADGFSEGLGVSNSATTGAATITNLPGGLVAAGGTTNVTVGLSTANAGTNNGTVTLGFNSSGVGTSGFAATNIGTTNINVVAVGYRLASDALSTTNVNLGRFHVGYNTNMGSLSGTVGITNTATGDGFSEGLAVADNGTTGGATVGGLPGGLVVAGSNTSISVGLGSISSVGNGNTGSVTLGFQSSGAGTSGFAATNIGTQVVNVSALGYSGQAYWNQDSGGSWNNFDNWDIPGGTPGIDGALLSTNDQATFGSMISASRTVNLEGQNPVLTLLAFSNSSASYTVAQGSGGSITMGTATNQTPVISNAAGSHTVSAGITLAYDTQANIAANAKLALSGALGGTKNFEKTGSGTLVIGGTGNLSGDTTVNAGTLEVNGAIAASDVTVNDGAVLSGSGSVGGIVLNLGGTVSPGNSPGTIYSTNVVWNPGGNYLWQIHNAAGTAGSTNGWDLVSVTNGGTLELGALDASNRFNIDLWSLSGINPDANGPALNFDNTQSYRWTILTAEGGIVDFATNKFNLILFATNGSAGWANNLGSGFITIDVQGNNLDLVFDPNTGPSGVPEPGTWAAAALLLGAAGYVRWRRGSRVA